MTTYIRHCRVCGAPFTKSRADITVNCPEHRKQTRVEAFADRATERAVEAKSRAYAARRSGDTEAYKAALADLLYWRDRGAHV